MHLTYSFPIDIGGRYHLNYAATILACISFVLVIAVYVIYWYGPVLRKRSPFAQSLQNAIMDKGDGNRRLSYLPSSSGTSHTRRLSRVSTTASRNANSRRQSQADFRRQSMPRLGSGMVR